MMQLIKGDDPEKKAVAEFHPHKRHFFVFRMSKHAFFEVQPIPEVVDAIDKFIGTPNAPPLSSRAPALICSPVSYLLVERRRRRDAEVFVDRTLRHSAVQIVQTKASSIDY